MNTVLKILALCGLIAAAAYGWTRFKRPRDESRPPSTAQQAIDGATGRTAVRAFIDTKEKIRDIGEQQARRQTVETP